MSLAAARVRDHARSALPRFELLTRSKPRWRPTPVTRCVMVLVASLAVLLLLHIELAKGAYIERQLSLKQIALMEEQQILDEQVSRDKSPAVLSERARGLGMIENSSPAFITLADGTVLGEPRPAQAPAEGEEPADLTDRAVPVGPVLPPGTDPDAPPAELPGAPSAGEDAADEPGVDDGARTDRATVTESEQAPVGDGAVRVGSRSEAARSAAGQSGSGQSDAARPAQTGPEQVADGAGRGPGAGR